MYYQQLLTGEMCCYDLEGAKLWSEGKMRFVVVFFNSFAVVESQHFHPQV